jgi:hypothetical protein
VAAAIVSVLLLSNCHEAGVFCQPNVPGSPGIDAGVCGSANPELNKKTIVQITPHPILVTYFASLGEGAENLIADATAKHHTENPASQLPQPLRSAMLRG